MGTTEPQDITGFDLKSLKEQADMDDKLFNWKEKGYKVELLGKEDMEGTEVYKIKLVDDEGDEYTHFIDAENYIDLKTVTKLKFGDQTQESETYYSNYEMIDGIAFPFSIENHMNGQMVSQINIEEVKMNVGVDDSIFNKPTKPAPEKP
ncbi:MAG: outer membrane lipoprotein-sorting protein, partial [Bacteroidales bacterium]|nr:outer membrane lipoprotein-sorting protein [Bacteroidales bacterium]